MSCTLHNQVNSSSGNCYQDVAFLVRGQFVYRKVVSCWASGDLAVPIECGAMTRAVKRLVRLGLQFALAVRANCGNSKKCRPAANQEKPPVAVVRINTILQVLPGRADIYN